MRFLPVSICEAGWGGDLETVRPWLAAHPEFIDLQSNGGNTLLVCALHAPCDLLLRYLIAEGANLEDLREGVAALHWAAGCTTSIERLHLLLDAGASVDFRDRRLQTPLYCAASTSTLAKTRLLVSRGASLDVIDDKGRSPEEYARLLGRTKNATRSVRCIQNADFLAAVRAAGGWPNYLREPRINLLMLRLLCQDGRAAAPAGTVLERLFPSRSAARKRRVARTTLPKEMFWHVASFWRSDRDD